MKCELCHKADAETALRLEKDGKEQELYVCKTCAAAAKHSGKKKDDGGKDVKVVRAGDKPPQFVEDFFKAAMELVDGLGHLAEERNTEKKVCPACHANWEQITKQERLGCPVCWKTFAREIRKEALGGCYGVAHVGSMPPEAPKGDTRAYLLRKQKAAIKRQDYETAAELQRRIDALGDEGGRQ